MPSGKYKKSESHKRKVSESLKGKHLSVKTEFKKGRKYSPTDETKEKLRVAHTGKKLSEETKAKMGIKNRGANHPNWIEDRTKIVDPMRRTWKYKKFRLSVLERDNYTCQNCGVRGIVLDVHHIKELQFYPKLAYIIENGVSLCKYCHKEVHRLIRIKKGVRYYDRNNWNN